MAHSSGLMFSLVVVIVALIGGASAQTTHIVLDSTGWTIPQPASAYADWAASKTFMVGDTLVFNFASGRHDVAQVNKTAFDACTTTNTIGPLVTSSPANITLDMAGEHFYICTFDGHCSLGQKLAINVTGSPSATPPTSPAPTGGPTVPSPTSPTSVPPTGGPTVLSVPPPTSVPPTGGPTVPSPTSPTSVPPTGGPTVPPTASPTSVPPTGAPTVPSPTSPTSVPPTGGPTVSSPPSPTSVPPTGGPTVSSPPPPTSVPPTGGPPVLTPPMSTGPAMPTTPSSASAAVTTNMLLMCVCLSEILLSLVATSIL